MYALGPACNTFKIDIIHNIQRIRSDLGNVDLLGLRHKRQIFVDLSLLFDFRLFSFFFQNLATLSIIL